MDRLPSAVSPVQFLEDARPFAGQNRFVVGTFERGVTFYRQQIRALNLIYSLDEAKDSGGNHKYARGARVAIIGGGAFGVTAAAAAAYAGFKTFLFERQQELLHLQRGCETRWVHPHFYDWPAPQSESRLARLPLLNWPAATAAQIATELEAQFTELASQSNGRLNAYLETSELRILKTGVGFEVHYRTAKDQGILPCDIVIYAVGLGTESGKNESYWRNDCLGQTELKFAGGDKIKYVVSGIGDGGLVDVFRLTIRDFRHEQIFSEIFPPPDSRLLARLRKLRESANPRVGWLYDEFNSLESSERTAISEAKALLKGRLRHDTKVILNGTEPSLRRGLTLDRISLSNALLVYCLYRIDAVRYQPGRIDPRKRRLIGIQKSPVRPSWLADAKVIVRHGTDRSKALRNVGFNSKAVKFVERQKEIRDSGQPIYPDGWWGRYTAPLDAANPGRAPSPVEFVPPALASHATTFVSTLGNVLQFLIDNKFQSRRRKKKFRVALHRLARFDGHEVFQQITPYAGRVENKAGVGRYFRVEGGVVGLACRTGSLVVTRKTDQKKFDKIWELTQLELSGAKPIRPYVDSLLACPFFASEKRASKQYVPLVLFADSAEADFFDDETLGAISAACRGFVEILENLHRSGALTPVPTFYSGYQVQRGTTVKRLVTRLRRLGVSFTDASDRGWKQGLTFKTLKSLDLEVGRSMKLGSEALLT